LADFTATASALPDMAPEKLIYKQKTVVIRVMAVITHHLVIFITPLNTAFSKRLAAIPTAKYAWIRGRINRWDRLRKISMERQTAAYLTEADTAAPLADALEIPVATLITPAPAVAPVARETVG
jgi:hypothetical protein